MDFNFADFYESFPSVNDTDLAALSSLLEAGPPADIVRLQELVSNKLNNSQSSSSASNDDQSIEIGLLILLIVIGVPLNAWSFYRKYSFLRSNCEDTRHDRLIFLQLNLLAANCLILLLYAVPKTIWLLTYYWYGGDVLCRIYYFFGMFGFYAYSNIIVAVTADLWYAILAPLSAVYMARSRAKRMIVIAWTLALLCSLPQFGLFKNVEVPAEYLVGTNVNSTGQIYQCINSWTMRDDSWHMAAVNVYHLTHLLIVFYIPLILIMVIFVAISFDLSRKMRYRETIRVPNRRQKRLFTDGVLQQQVVNKAHRPAQSAGQKLLKMSLMVVCPYVLLWLPYQVNALYKTICKLWTLEYSGFMVFWLESFMIANACVGPLLCWQKTSRNALYSMGIGKAEAKQRCRILAEEFALCDISSKPSAVSKAPSEKISRVSVFGNKLSVELAKLPLKRKTAIVTQRRTALANVKLLNDIENSDAKGMLLSNGHFTNGTLKIEPDSDNEHHNFHIVKKDSNGTVYYQFDSKYTNGLVHKESDAAYTNGILRRESDVDRTSFNFRHGQKEYEYPNGLLHKKSDFAYTNGTLRKESDSSSVSPNFQVSKNNDPKLTTSLVYIERDAACKSGTQMKKWNECTNGTLQEQLKSKKNSCMAGKNIGFECRNKNSDETLEELGIVKKQTKSVRIAHNTGFEDTSVAQPCESAEKTALNKNEAIITSDLALQITRPKNLALDSYVLTATV